MEFGASLKARKNRKEEESSSKKELAERTSGEYRDEQRVLQKPRGHALVHLSAGYGPDGNYKDLPNLSKWILAAGMLLGRLELFAVLVLFFPSFWKN